jgi:hypothetical protein
MKAPLLLSEPHRTSLRARRSRVHERVRARLFPWRLDLELARGAPADSRGDLLIRAHRLISLRTRRDLATEILAVLEEAMDPTPARHRVVRGCDVEVLVAGPLLQEIADRLARPGPVEAAGVARIRILLHDGTGPLYSETWTGKLEPALRRALKALAPRDGAPVIA